MNNATTNNTDLTNLTDEQLDAQLEDARYDMLWGVDEKTFDALAEERQRRCEQRWAEMAEYDPLADDSLDEVEEVEEVEQTTTVKLTDAQHAWAARVLSVETDRLVLTREEAASLLGQWDDAIAYEGEGIIECGMDWCETPNERAFAARQIRRSWACIRRKLAAAAGE